MTEPFLGQVKAFGFGIIPRGYALCDGRLLAISQNQALFSLLGTMYGGDGRTTFGLPDLRGRTPLGMGASYPEGMISGTENVTLLPTQLPPHVHPVQYSTSPGPARNPANAMYGGTNGGAPLYAAGTGPQVPLNPTTIGFSAGAASPHPNMQPFTVLNFCIATQGIFPSRS